MQTYKLTIDLAGGQTAETEVELPSDLEEDEAVAYVETRMLAARGVTPFKRIGHVLAHHGAISAITVEPL